ncbi:cell envelope integrity protein CreD [Flavobacterium suzhouense]|uniref:Cell envelope integrity protein CreD n=1 Tax=Flavobacterium suzhouense TaxID=1529638 RepID=A0ABW5NW22_9FLAO
METNQSHHSSPLQQPGQTTNFFQSSTAKILMVGLLTLVLLIPLQYVKSLIFERSERQKEVVNEINSKWGGQVYFCGPILKVPYSTYTENKLIDEKTKQVTIQRSRIDQFAYFLPNELNADVNVNTLQKNRSNYESVVYNSAMKFKGNYTYPSFGDNALPENIHWDKATILIKTNNIKSITGGVTVNIGGKKYSFEPAPSDKENDTLSSLETQPVNLTTAFTTGPASFDLNINYKGSEKIAIVPIGKMTHASMTSNWPSPSFDGSFLPENSNITEKGFSANWKVSHLNRSFGQQHFGSLPNLQANTFDVKFLIPVNQYQQNERAAKYGFLVIGLTFLVFFLIQSVSKIAIHIFQYSMIGLALIMFYTLLISITEHSTFRLAYIIAGISVVVMIALYSISILKNKKFPVFIAISLSALYSFIYVIIQLENYALLVGSIGLFAILGAVMYFSRKIEWK